MGNTSPLNLGVSDKDMGLPIPNRFAVPLCSHFSPLSFHDRKLLWHEKGGIPPKGDNPSSSHPKNSHVPQPESPDPFCWRGRTVTCYQTGGAEWVAATAQGDNQGAASKLGTFPPSWPCSVSVLLGRVEANLPRLLQRTCFISAGDQENNSKKCLEKDHCLPVWERPLTMKTDTMLYTH